jgi:predicted membrane protein
MKKIATGIIIVLTGTFLLSYHLGLLPEMYFRIVFSWQTLLIAIGTIQLADRGKFHNYKDAGIIFITVGLVFLIPRIAAIWFPNMLFPRNMRGSVFSVLVIIFGVFLIVKAQKRRRRDGYRHFRHTDDFESMPFSEMESNDSECIKQEYVFSAAKERIAPGEIKWVEIEAVFSGVEIDFSQAELSREAEKVYIKVTSVFSGVTLYLPSEWNVRIQKTGVFGGFAGDKCAGRPASRPDGPLVFLELEAVFGGGEVKYHE